MTKVFLQCTLILKALHEHPQICQTYESQNYKDSNELHSCKRETKTNFPIRD